MRENPWVAVSPACIAIQPSRSSYRRRRRSPYLEGKNTVFCVRSRVAFPVDLQVLGNFADPQHIGGHSVPHLDGKLEAAVKVLQKFSRNNGWPMGAELSRQDHARAMAARNVRNSIDLLRHFG